MTTVPWDHNTHHHDVLLRALPARFERAVDIGCGEGWFARALAARASAVEGIDRDEAMVRLATATHADVPNVRFRVADLRSLEPGSYDAVSALAVVHHLPLDEALARLSALVAPGGTLIVLGLYQERTPTWFVWSCVAAVVHRALRHRHGERTYPAPMKDPTTSMREIRATAARVLPGARVRRRLLWRYTLVWEAQ